MTFRLVLAIAALLYAYALHALRGQTVQPVHVAWLAWQAWQLPEKLFRSASRE